MPMTPEHAAHHEAGHATAAVLQHRRFKRVWLADTVGGVEYKLLKQPATRRRLEREIRICLAGFLAGLLHDMQGAPIIQPPPVWGMVLDTERRSQEDLSIGRGYARLLLGIEPTRSLTYEENEHVYRCLEEQAPATEKLLRQGWRSVAAVATELLAAKELSWVEVHRIVARVQMRDGSS